MKSKEVEDILAAIEYLSHSESPIIMAGKKISEHDRLLAVSFLEYALVKKLNLDDRKIIFKTVQIKLNSGKSKSYEWLIEALKNSLKLTERYKNEKQ